MNLRIRAGAIHVVELQTRMPFKYGIATMTRAPHAFVRLDVEIDGVVTTGIAADLLGSAAFGATTVSLLPVALGFGLRDRTAGDPTLVTGAIFVGAGALAHHLAQALVLVLVGAALPPLGILLAGAVGSAIYTGTLALAAYPLLRMLHRRTAREPAFDW